MPTYRQLSDKGADGTQFGQNRSDLIALYGTTPVSQRAAAVQGSTFASIATSTDFAAAQQTVVNAALATLNEVVATLTALGIWKGSA